MTETQTIRCLSVQPAMAYAIANLGKDIENRSWRTYYTGWVYIHASSSRDGYKLHKDWIEKEAGLVCPAFKDLPQGAIICRVWLGDIPLAPAGKEEKTQWGMPGCYWWPLSKVERIEPISMKGKLGLFKTEIPM
ncbi:MAG TPA: hypothetical protein V6D33_13365 [Cyanophyceae cyanobacterium]